MLDDLFLGRRVVVAAQPKDLWLRDFARQQEERSRAVIWERLRSKIDPKSPRIVAWDDGNIYDDAFMFYDMASGGMFFLRQNLGRSFTWKQFGINENLLEDPVIARELLKIAETNAAVEEIQCLQGNSLCDPHMRDESRRIAEEEARQSGLTNEERRQIAEEVAAIRRHPDFQKLSAGPVTTSPSTQSVSSSSGVWIIALIGVGIVGAAALLLKDKS